MVALKIAWQFIKKSKIHSFVIFLTVVIGVGLQFFVFSLGNVLSSMILEQATIFQNHLVINKDIEKKLSFNEFDYDFRDQLVSEFSEIKAAVYAESVNGSISNEEGLILPFSLVICEPSNDANDYREFYGLSNEENIITGRANNLNENEIMLDDYFARQSNLKVGDTITFANNLLQQEFLIVGTYDLGIFRGARIIPLFLIQVFHRLSRLPSH